MTIAINDSATTVSIVADAPIAVATAIPVTTNYAVPVKTNYAVSDPSSIKPPATTSTIPAPAASNTVTSHPPPGIKDGGRWGTTNVIGPATWSACATVCCVGLLFAGILAPFGLCAFACPCDKGDVYAIDGQVYNIKGSLLGKESNFAILPHTR
jgi:hypothetical protein